MMPWRRKRLVKDPDFEIWYARSRDRRGRWSNVYEWHRWLWAVNPEHPNHAHGLAAMQTRMQLS